ncbi:MAG TPA: AEC family transporter [Deltaproteobacteria bacterium]|nr:AEC family transporter [Deltaproteobacteria bacterium]HQB38678.1 AEC family transporter [Deltaproteobacteria bacterium]
MHLFIEILNIVLPVFLVIGIGTGLKHTGLIDSGFLFQTNRLIYYLALPLLLFHKISTADFRATFNPLVVLNIVLAMCVVLAGSYLYASLRGYSPASRGTFCQCSFRGNLAYVGLAIVASAFGETGLARAGVLLGFLVPVMNVLVILVLTLAQAGNGPDKGLGHYVSEILRNPLIIASLAGLAWSFLQLPMPVAVGRTLQIATGMSLPLALIAIGGSFSLQRLQGDMYKALLATGIKNVSMPLIALPLLLMAGIRGEELAVAVVMAAAPTATATYIMAQEMKGDAELAGSIVILSTLFSLPVYVAILYLLRTIGG